MCVSFHLLSLLNRVLNKVSVHFCPRRAPQHSEVAVVAYSGLGVGGCKGDTRDQCPQAIPASSDMQILLCLSPCTASAGSRRRGPGSGRLVTSTGNSPQCCRRRKQPDWDAGLRGKEFGLPSPLPHIYTHFSDLRGKP